MNMCMSYDTKPTNWVLMIIFVYMKIVLFMFSNYVYTPN